MNLINALPKHRRSGVESFWLTLAAVGNGLWGCGYQAEDGKFLRGWYFEAPTSESAVQKLYDHYKTFIDVALMLERSRETSFEE
jgi:hypothetical protein